MSILVIKNPVQGLSFHQKKHVFSKNLFHKIKL